MTNYEELKDFLIENGDNPKWAEHFVKEIELADEIDFWIKSIREYPDGEWEHSESWYELVDACYTWRKHGKDYGKQM